MNKLVKISIFLIAVLALGNLHNTISQIVKAQLDTISPYNQTDQKNTTAAVKSDDQKNAKIKEGLAIIFELYQVLAEKGDKDSLMKLHTLEGILIGMMK